MQTISMAAALLLPAMALGQQWDNPSERYANEYKAYEKTECPIEKGRIQHFVYFSRDREGIRDHPALSHPRFAGAQIMYSWAELEPARGKYDFSIIREDLEYLRSRGKRLFIQIQDATFNPKHNAAPPYLLTPAYDGGAVYQRKENGEPEGWVAKRWNAAVRERFALFLEALGQELDGKIEGVNLQESSIGMSGGDDPSFSPAVYAESLKVNMLALKQAFPRSVTMQYANFMPGEWLPWEDEGYLKSIYDYGQTIGVGLGAPDLMPRRKGQLNHALAMMHEGQFSVPLGIAVQDGNYVGVTGAEEASGPRDNIVPMLHAFARDFLGVEYMFWSNQKPYFEEDVLPCFDAAQ